MKVSELQGALLDYWVARADDSNPTLNLLGKYPGGREVFVDYVRTKDYGCYRPSTDWSQGGPIIEKYGIDTTVQMESATTNDDLANDSRVWGAERDGWAEYWGQTPLIAAMRCFVSSKYGDEVPDEETKA